MKDLADIRGFILNQSHSKLVLCTLVRKEGSSYRGVGAKKIISSSASLGLLSGGCLEASIEKTARERYAELPFLETFDMLADEDRLLGYQTGCQGAITILFERIPQTSDVDLYIPFGPAPRACGVSVSLEAGTLGKRLFKDYVSHDSNQLFEPWIEPVQLVIVGCGADADAYAPLAESLGWQTTYIDYRRDLVSRFKNGVHAPAEKIPQFIPQGPRVAVMLMTHNYEADMEIVRAMDGHRIGYLGCLGPRKRFDRLQEDLKKLHGHTVAENLKSVAHAPAGIFTHNRSPEEIALSAVAQIQQQLIELAAARTWSVILAAGESKRYGGVKALAPIGDKTFLSRAIATAREFSGEKTLVVTGAHRETVQSHISAIPTVHNEGWSEGMGSSIRVGVEAILAKDPHADGILILPVDQPFVTAGHLRALERAGKSSGRCALTASADQFGPPAFVPRSLFGVARELRGDRGLKAILGASQMIAVESPEAFADFDRGMCAPHDLA